MDQVVRKLLLERVRASALGDEAVALIVAACAEGERGAIDAAPEPIWLRSIAVEGFRGIGPSATLALEPRPGLTLVVGRNGSGKSSFAEGLELLTTGTLKRWAKRPKAWTQAWQCLHYDGPTRISATFLRSGTDEPLALTQTWDRGAAHDAPTSRRAASAWDAALTSFRPFLSYAELATMFDTLTSLYDALSPVLGLGDVDDLLAALGRERLAMAKRAAESKDAARGLADALDDTDARQLALAAALRAPKRNLDAIAELAKPRAGRVDAGASATALRRLTALAAPEPQAVADAFADLRAATAIHAETAATDAARASQLADLLRAALRLRDHGRPADDCPVCGAADALDAAWERHASEAAEALDEQAAALRNATRSLAACRATLAGLFDATARDAGALAAAAGLENAAVDLDGVLEDEAAALAAAAALARLRERASDELDRRDSAWQERAAATAVWLEDARAVAGQAASLRAHKAAETWLKTVADELRAERFSPIADQAIANWRQLRQGSNVELHDIALRRQGRGGRADFDVRADGEPANALGVMSQGELLALSVSVFLPRAALDESPFRFAVIDDPVQAMDPAKVDGLARVLHAAAATRQLIVFTHDDRLPEAVRRLHLAASVLQVDRRARSSVAIRVSPSAVRRHLDDAKRVAANGDMPLDVRARIVPTLCRTAVEARCAELVRERAARTGVGVDDVERRLRGARTLRQALALALFDDVERVRDLGQMLNGAELSLVKLLNGGAHGGIAGDESVRRLPAQAIELVHGLAA